MRALLFVIAATATAHAGPAYPECVTATKPFTSHDVNGVAVACWGSECVDAATGKPTRTPVFAVRRTSDKVELCVAATCATPGKTLAAAIAAWLDAYAKASLVMADGYRAEVTRDGKYMVLRNPYAKPMSQLYSVASDARIVVGTKEPDLEISGNLVIAHDDKVAWFVDEHGAAVGATFPSGMVAPLADDAIVVVRDGNAIVVDRKGEAGTALALPKQIDVVFDVGGVRARDVVIVVGGRKDVRLFVVSISNDVTIISTS